MVVICFGSVSLVLDLVHMIFWLLHDVLSLENL